MKYFAPLLLFLSPLALTSADTSIEVDESFGSAFVFRNGELDRDCLATYYPAFSLNAVIQARCIDTAQTLWHVDGNSYIRSHNDRNKCIVGENLSTSPGTTLVVGDCIPNDTRFVFNYHSDQTFRPEQDITLCIVSNSNDPISNGYWKIELNYCSGSIEQRWKAEPGPFRRVLLSEGEDMSQGIEDSSCKDLPQDWYDVNGENCAWYAHGNNCRNYGSQNKNFGKSANQACCACGGGSSSTALDMDDVRNQDSKANGVPVHDIVFNDFGDFYRNLGDENNNKKTRESTTKTNLRP